MPKTQEEHMVYTLREWRSNFFQEVLRRIFTDDIKVVYDIGANVGGVTIVILEYVKNIGKKLDKIYCFEPDKENFHYLQKNILVDNVIFLNFGLFYGKTESKAYNIGWKADGSLDGNIGGYICDETIAEQIVAMRHEKGHEMFYDKSKCSTFDVDCKTFELKELEELDILPADFIKIDIEGAEKNLLENSKYIHKAKYILVEYNYNDASTFFGKYLPEFHVLMSNGVDYLLKNTN